MTIFYLDTSVLIKLYRTEEKEGFKVISAEDDRIDELNILRSLE